MTEQCIIASVDLMVDHDDLREQAIEAGFDLLVVDEAHHLMWSEEGGNDRYDLVKSSLKIQQGYYYSLQHLNN